MSNWLWLEHEMNNDDLPKLVFSHHPLNHHEIQRNFLIPKENCTVDEGGQP